MPLTIESISKDDYHLISLTGDVDTKTAPSLMEALTGLELAGLSELRIEMASVGFLSSAGLRVLVFAKQKMPHASRLILVGTSDEIADVINKTGLSQAMSLVPSHEEA
ncbi:STAS domain-containing protein [Cyanobium sp. WAJ14-Wanaka]|uniref:STAS domain-containing protein n=1 Tax=Cyanobium sp. WAJ14-Wanaka TaxID=2823725 RepID=UPI0020CBF21B|nr:STAS domain-containing protein [Cyanobium sp. WAJ14-Wanaka]MCP9775907.1 STAS domain-containing protein [Cyanobium sp. WAJ14-Wanaka]